MGHPHRTRRRQQGVTLIVTLIVLMALSLLAAWAVTSGTTNQRVVGNQQAYEEATSAAQNAIETAISTSDFTLKTAALAAADIAVDLDGDGATDLRARLTPEPTCYRARQVQEEELDVEARPEDKVCLRSEDTLSAGAGTNCQATEWNLRAVATDERTGAEVAVNQGVALRVLGPGASCASAP